MKKIIFILFSFVGLVLANEVIEMKAFNPIKDFDILAPNEKKVKAMKISKGFSSQVKNINSVHTILQAEDGFYISGNSLTTDNINLKFNSESFAKSIGGVGYYSSDANKETFSLSSKNIFVSLLHYDKDGKFLWRNDFANDMLTSTAIVRLKNGKLIVALTPIYIEKDKAFQSYIFIYSKSGKLLSKRKYKDYIINSLHVAKKNKILCGTNKKVKGKFRETALIIDDEGFKVKSIDLDSRSYLESVFQDLTKIKKISTGYFLYGGQDIVKLDKYFKLQKNFYIGPRIDKYSSYFVDTVYEDKDEDIHMLGNYGHKSNAIQTMKLDRLKRMNSPRTIQDQLDPASRAMRRNSIMSMAYDEMLREQREYNQERSHGYTSVYTKDNKLLTLIKEGDYGSGLDFHGSSDTMLYFEYLEDEKNTRQFLFDKDMKLIMSSKYSEQFCEIKCVLKGKNLFYISLDEKTASLKFNKIGFEIQ